MVRVISRLRRLASSISNVPELPIRHQPVDVVERAFLRLGEIIEDGPGSADRLGVGRAVVEAKALQPGRAKVLGQHLPCGRLAKTPTPGGA